MIVPVLVAVCAVATVNDVADVDPDCVAIAVTTGVFHSVVFKLKDLLSNSPDGPVAVTVTVVVDMAAVFCGIVMTPVEELI